MSSGSLGWQTPLYVLISVTTDISALLYFHFWEPVYFAMGDSLKYEEKPGFPSETSEAKGYFVGFGESVEDIRTTKSSLRTPRRLSTGPMYGQHSQKTNVTDVSIRPK